MPRTLSDYPIPRCVLLAGLLLSLALPLSTARAREANVDLASDEYVLRSWEGDDIGTQLTISGIAQTPDGYLWLATWGGLARFDGVRFKLFTASTTPEFATNYVRSVFTARDGALWIGLERGGVLRMRDGRFTEIARVKAPTAHTRWVSSFAEDAGGAIWYGLAPERTAMRWKDGQSSAFETSEISAGMDSDASGDSYVRAAVDGSIWYSTKAGCGVFDGARFQLKSSPEPHYICLCTATDGGVWAVDDTKLRKYQADGKNDAIADLAMLHSPVDALIEDRGGDLWIGTRGNGMFRYRAGQVTRVLNSHAAVQAIMQDRDDNIWVATRGGGLHRLHPRRFSFRQVAHGLGSDGVTSICKDSEGRLWLAIQDGPLVRGLDRTNRAFAVPPGWNGGTRAAALCADAAGGIWIGSDGLNLTHWEKGRFTDARMDLHIGALFMDSHSDLWAGSMQKLLCRHEHGEVEEISNGEELAVPRVISEDREGAVWVGTAYGLLSRKSGAAFVSIALPGAKAGESIRFLVPDGDAMWIGALAGGLYRWQAGLCEHLPPDRGLPADDLRALAIDDSGAFWFATGGGLFRVSRVELEAAMAGRLPVVHALHFGRDDDVANVDFTSGGHNATARTEDGHYWFASAQGALEISPEKIQVAAPEKAPLIESVRVNGTEAPVNHQTLRLPPNPGTVEISFTAPNLSTPEQLRFRYRLAGIDRDWSLDDGRRMATFSRLAAGKYRFEAETAAADGPWLPATAHFDFEVRAAWWKTALARIVAVLIAAAALSLAVRAWVLRRVRMRIRAIEQERALERERARIARDMHDDLGAGLTQICLMAELGADQPEPDDATADRLGRIARAARSVSGALETIVWTVNPRNDTLQRLIDYLAKFASEHMAAAGIELALDLPVEIPDRVVQADARHHLLLASKEALNNIAKHANAQRAALQITLTGAQLRIKISDDGAGLPLNGNGRQGHGLENIQQRLSALGGSARMESHPASGTTVTFEAPLPTCRVS